MRVVIVGGCGFMGRHIGNRLVEIGANVTSVHRSPAHPSEPHWECVQADYRDQGAMSTALTGADALVHLGSQSVPRTSIALGVTGILDEVQANSGLFETAARLGVPRVVFASSGGSAYGVCKPLGPIAEDHITRPISPHGLLKVMTELVLSHVALTAGQSAVALRPGNVYGPGQRSQRMFGVVPTFINNLESGKPSEIWGAEVVRDYVFVEDAAEAFTRATVHSGELPRAINVGSGQGHTALEIYSELQEALQVNLPVTVVPRPPADPPWNVLSTDLLREQLGFVPATPLSVGLRKAVEATIQSERSDRP